MAIGRRAFRFAAPTIWNSIPLSIRSLPSLNSFKRSLKPTYSLSTRHDPDRATPAPLTRALLEFVRYTNVI